MANGLELLTLALIAIPAIGGLGILCKGIGMLMGDVKKK